MKNGFTREGCHGWKHPEDDPPKTTSERPQSGPGDAVNSQRKSLIF